MTPAYHDEWLTIYGGDVREVLPELASDSVDCIVTSPPYWGLRDYGTASWAGGDAECDHRPPPAGRAERPLGAFHGGSDEFLPAAPYKDVCGRCGAVRQDSQIGLERTPEEYVANLVAVFRELRRVLKPSGTCFLNLGDSYATGAGRVGERPGGGTQGDNWQGAMTSPNRMPLPGLKPKDLVGIPWRVAFALQADGWYLRSDIIWSKPNPMPESVTDRPTKAHEYLFLLTRSARYYYDADAVREAALPSSLERYKYADPGTTRINKGGAYREKWDEKDKHIGVPTVPDNPAGRNLRSVWTIATRPYPGAHFAVFPPELPERCIKAGSSERGVCPECGAPWERVVERNPGFTDGKCNGCGRIEAQHIQSLKSSMVSKRGQAVPCGSSSTSGWRPTCVHTADPIPATVLDPFAGSGTTGMVANRLSRRAILIDLNPDYLRQQMTRNAQTPLGLTEGDAA